MCQQWNEEYFAKSSESQKIAVNQWLARVTLDAIGEGRTICFERVLY